MFKTISVLQYKKFKTLIALSELKQINYLVWKNNAGKSSFMEAVLLSTMKFNEESKNFDSAWVWNQFANLKDYFFDNEIETSIITSFDWLKVEMKYNQHNNIVKEIAQNKMNKWLPKILYVPCKPNFNRTSSKSNYDTILTNVNNHWVLRPEDVEPLIVNSERIWEDNGIIHKAWNSDEFKTLSSIISDIFWITLSTPFISARDDSRILKYKENGTEKEKMLYLLWSWAKTLINLIWAIIYAKDYDIILIDEPELHLNAWIERKLPKILRMAAKAANKQLIIATQSPFVIWNITSNSEKAFLFKLEKNWDTLIEDKFSDSTVNLAVSMEMWSDDPASIWAPQNFILTEEASLQSLLNIVNRRFYSKNIQIIACSWVDDIQNKNKAFLNIINHNTILKCTPIYLEKYIVIVDKIIDKSTHEREINNIKEKLKDRFIELNEDRIENYYPDNFLKEFAKKNEINASSSLDVKSVINNWIWKDKKSWIRKCKLAEYIWNHFSNKNEFETIFPELVSIFN